MSEAKPRAVRRCLHCPTILNSFNAGSVCGPCKHERRLDWLREQQARMAEREAARLDHQAAASRASRARIKGRQSA